VALVISPALTLSPATTTSVHDRDHDQGVDATTLPVTVLTVGTTTIMNDNGRNDGGCGGERGYY